MITIDEVGVIVIDEVVGVKLILGDVEVVVVTVILGVDIFK